MTQEFDIRGEINKILEPLVWVDQSHFELLDLSTRIFPNLMAEAIYGASDDDKLKLKEIKALVDAHQVNVVVNAEPKPKRSLMEDIKTKKYRVDERDGYSLGILVNPTITYALEAFDDKKEILVRVRQVMLETHEIYEELLRSRQFVPRTEV